MRTSTTPGSIPAPHRPRLLFVTGSTKGIEPYFLLSAVQPWEEGLAQHFEVKTVTNPQEIEPETERFHPDMVLFFGAKYRLLYDGPALDFRRRLDVPMAALSLMDAHSPAKPAFFEHAWRLGVEAIFTIDTGMREMAGEYADRVFYCPWFVNHSMSRDFGEPKDIPITMAGDGFMATGADWRYPWRRKVAEQLRKQFGTFTSPRPTPGFSHGLVGEAYGRLLNRSQLAFCCGAARHIFMRKNLEIPASRCCMVSEENATLRHLGFQDMENCVFVTPENAVEKCTELLANPERLKEITDRGRDFVLTHHDAAHRAVIAEWLAATKKLPPRGRILQPDLCGPLRTVTEEDASRSILLSGASPFLRAMQETLVPATREDCVAMQAGAKKAETMHAWTVESVFVFGIVALISDKPTEAVDSFQMALRRGIFWGCERPDPMLWGFYLLALTLSGLREQAVALAAKFTDVRHPLLDQVRLWLGVEIPAIASTPSTLSYPFQNPTAAIEFAIRLMECRQGGDL